MNVVFFVKCSTLGPLVSPSFFWKDVLLVLNSLNHVDPLMTNLSFYASKLGTGLVKILLEELTSLSTFVMLNRPLTHY